MTNYDLLCLLSKNTQMETVFIRFIKSPRLEVELYKFYH